MSLEQQFCNVRFPELTLDDYDIHNPDSKNIIKYLLSMMVDDEAYENFMMQMRRLRKPIEDISGEDLVEKLIKQIRVNPEQVAIVSGYFMAIVYWGSRIDFSTYVRHRSFEL